MTATIWSILPPVIAIVLALITKEVYMSLLIGIFAGAILYQPGIITPINTTFQIMGDKIGGNADIVIFLVLLGICLLVCTVQAFDIIECYTIPEKTILEYLNNLMNTASN